MGLEASGEIETVESPQSSSIAPYSGVMWSVLRDLTEENITKGSYLSMDCF